MTNFETQLRDIYACLSRQVQCSFLFGFTTTCQITGKIILVFSLKLIAIIHQQLSFHLNFNHIFLFNSLMNWTQREAYLLLKEREDAGIFPISKDFIDPEKVILPSDEELGDIDILI